LNPLGRAAGLAVAAALIVAVAPGSAPGSDSVEAHASKRRAARQHCSRSSRGAHRRHRHRRRLACARIRRLAVEPPAEERLVQVDAPRPPAGEPPPPGDAPAPGPVPVPRFASVAAREFSLTLSRPVVGAGSVTIELRNVGEDPHNLVLSPDDGSHDPLASWDETQPGGVLRRSVSLPAGRYLLFCSLEGHEALGMSARLRVE
jgi:hypothetical protein